MAPDGETTHANGCARMACQLCRLHGESCTERVARAGCTGDTGHPQLTAQLPRSLTHLTRSSSCKPRPVVCSRSTALHFERSSAAAAALPAAASTEKHCSMAARRMAGPLAPSSGHHPHRQQGLLVCDSATKMGSSRFQERRSKRI